MSVIHRISGLTGVVLFFSLLIAFTCFWLFKLVHARADNTILASFVTFLAIVSSTLHWLARPHVFTLILTVVWYYVLNEYHYKHKNLLYLLPPIMLLWVNLHGGFIIGFVLLAIYLCGNAAGAFFPLVPEKSQYQDKFRALSYTAIASVLFASLNPYGLHVLLFPFKTVSQQFLIDSTLEYLSPNFHDPLPFKYLFFLTLGILAVSRVKIDAIEICLFLLFTYMALYSARHIPLFAIVIAPILARHTTALFERTNSRFISIFKSRSDNLESLDACLKGHLWPVVTIVAVCLLGRAGVVKFTFDQTRAPVAAVDFLKKEKIEGKMFNNDQFGDYVIYASPDYKVFVDGRSDMYGSDRMKEYMQVALVRPGWKHVLAKYDVNFVLYNDKSPLSLLLAENDSWRLIYADTIANIFVRNVAQNQELIDKYNNVKLVLGEAPSVMRVTNTGPVQ
jgi:hypothetical protein